MAKDGAAPTTDEILSKPEAFGLTFDVGKLGYKAADKKTYIALPPQPYLRVVNTSTFDKHFPGVIAKHSNGSSVKVHSQAIGRQLAKADRKVPPATVKRALVDGICFGATTSASTTVITVTEVQKMTDAEAAGVLALLVDSGMTADAAAAAVAKIRGA